MIDPLMLAIFTLCAIAGAIGAATGYMLATIRERRRVADLPPPVLPAHLYDELNDLRHLKEQLEHPPQSHQHIWPREPDVRKMGWLRYRCAYANCPAIEWRPR